jgi:glutathione S-transferase
MEITALVAVLVALQYLVFIVLVGRARGRYGISAPAMTGHPVFERMVRVQQNTLEQLVIFFPALALFAHFINPLWAAALGLLFFVGRALYARTYVLEPSKRGPGFGLGALALIVLLLGALWGAARAAL